MAGWSMGVVVVWLSAILDISVKCEFRVAFPHPRVMSSRRPRRRRFNVSVSECVHDRLLRLLLRLLVLVYLRIKCVPAGSGEGEMGAFI